VEVEDGELFEVWRNTNTKTLLNKENRMYAGVMIHA